MQRDTLVHEIHAEQSKGPKHLKGFWGHCIVLRIVHHTGKRFWHQVQRCANFLMQQVQASSVPSQTIPLARIFHHSQYPQPERSLWLQAWLSFGHLTLSQIPIGFLLFSDFWVDLLTHRHCICEVIQALCNTLYAIPPAVHLAFVECPLRSIREF